MSVEPNAAAHAARSSSTIHGIVHFFLLPSAAVVRKTASFLAISKPP